MAFTLKAVTKMGKKRYKESLHIIPYFFTFANALFGFLSVIAALKGNFILAASYIGLAACMDACDGRLARAFGSTSYLGAELDGLCDAISFCCAPPILLYCFYQDTMGIVGLAILGSYLCAGLFRLAKFNTTKTTYNGYFSGLSTPATIPIASFAKLTAIPNPWPGIRSGCEFIL
jgi:CDP-diacylglycerol---serine O-phosphatidyltransferase